VWGKYSGRRFRKENNAILVGEEGRKKLKNKKYWANEVKSQVTREFREKKGYTFGHPVGSSIQKKRELYRLVSSFVLNTEN